MGPLWEYLFNNTDPVVATLLIAILFYIKLIRRDLKEEIKALRSRMIRLEDELIGGKNG